MNRRNAANVLAILAVVAVVAGAVWLKSRRAAEPDGTPGLSALPRAVAQHESQPPVSPAEEHRPEPEAVPLVGQGQVASALKEVEEKPTARVALPRLVDLGANKCKECKALAPILDALREEYKGRLSVEFVDLWKSPKAADPYKIRLIPTQILYDKAGNELWRHEGFISKEDLKALFAAKVGVK